MSGLRTIIAGSRTVSNLSDVMLAIKQCGFKISTVLSGGARGADKLGEKAASLLNLPVEIFPADWNRYGKSAGYRRNEVMAAHAQALIAIWDGESRGTAHMINLAKDKGLTVYIYRI